MASPIERLADGSWRLHDAATGRTQRAWAVTDAGGAVWIHVDGEVIVDAGAERAATRRAAAGDTGLEAPMPAQVTAVLVGPGDTVTHGQPLILLEAMKMELPVRAPSDGRIDAVNCAPGDRVSPGRALVELTPRESDT